MKKHYTLPTICFILSGVTIFLIGYLWKIHYNNNRFSNDTSMKYSGRTLLPGEEICGSQDIECPELQKINDRISLTNDITATSYTITTGSGGETIATINFPAFSDRTIEEKRKIFHEIRTSNAQVLALGIVRIDQDYENDIRDILSNMSFGELRIQIYAEPENIIELFDIITWEKADNMKLTLEFINLYLPTDLKIFNYIYMSEKMVKRNNGNIPLASFSIIFNPLFDEFDSLYDRYILYPAEKKLLMNIPTNELNIKGLHTTYTNRTDGMYENQKGKTYDFLKNNPIPDIYIDSIGKKENGDITLTGF